MKLLHCLKCGDIFGLLVGKERVCECGASKGQYVDNRNAEYEGPARIIGMDNADLKGSRGGLPGQTGEQYPWWVISDSCKPVRKLDKFPLRPMASTKRVRRAPSRSPLLGTGHDSIAADLLSIDMLHRGDDPGDPYADDLGDYDTGQPDAWGEDPGGYEP